MDRIIPPPTPIKTKVLRVIEWSIDRDVLEIYRYIERERERKSTVNKEKKKSGRKLKVKNIRLNFFRCY